VETGSQTVLTGSAGGGGDDLLTSGVVVSQWRVVWSAVAWTSSSAWTPPSQVEVLGWGARQRRAAVPSDHSTPSARVVVWWTRWKRRACRCSVFTSSDCPEGAAYNRCGLWAVGTAHSPHALVFHGFCRRGLV